MGKSVFVLGFNHDVFGSDIYMKAIEKEIAIHKGLSSANDFLSYAGNFGEPGSDFIGKGLGFGYGRMTTTMQIWTYSNFSKTTRLVNIGGKVMGASATYIGAPLSTYLDYKAMRRNEIGVQRFAFRTIGVGTEIGVGVIYGPISGAITDGLFWSGEKAYDAYIYWQNQMAIFLNNVENGLKMDGFQVNKF